MSCSSAECINIIAAHLYRILVLLEQLTSQLAITEARFSYFRTAFALAGEEVNVVGFIGTTVGVDFSQTNVITFNNERSSTISLPGTILGNVTTNGTSRITYAAFRNGNLFNTSMTTATLGGTVIAGRVVNQSVNNLEDPLTITFTKNQVSSQSHVQNLSRLHTTDHCLLFSLPAIMAQIPDVSSGTSMQMVCMLLAATALHSFL